MSNTRSTRLRRWLPLLLTVLAFLALLLVPAAFLGLVSRYYLLRTEAAQRRRCTYEMIQLGNAISAFRAKFNVTYIPGGPFRLRSKYIWVDRVGIDPEAIYLKQVFPHLNLENTGLPDRTLPDGNATLMFFLTGAVVTDHQGFSTNKAQPFALPRSRGEDRIGPFFDPGPQKFDREGRLLDPWGTPYAYSRATPTATPTRTPPSPGSTRMGAASPLPPTSRTTGT